MRNIEVPDALYEEIARLATERGVSMRHILQEWVANEEWAEHATQAYDRYVPGTGEVFLSDEEFLSSLTADTSASESSDDEGRDANIRADS